MGSYVVTIDGVAILEGGVVEGVVFKSSIDSSNKVRGQDLGITVTITGRVSFYGKTSFMKDFAQAVAEWSVVKAGASEVYKEVTIEYTHEQATRKFVLPDAFVVSYTESYGSEDGSFELIIKQKFDVNEDVEV